MASPSDEIVFHGNAQQLLAEYAKMREALRAEEAALSQIARSAKAAEQEEARWARTAAKDAEQALSPKEKYNREVARLQTLLQKGAIDQTTYNLALQRQNELLDSATQKAGDATQSILGIGTEALVAFTGIGSAIAGVMAAASALKAEYEQMRERQERARDANISFADAIRGAAVNFAADDTISAAQFEPEILRIASATGAKPEAVAQIVGAALSSKANLSNAVAFETVEQALRVLPQDAAGAEQLAARALHLMAPAGLTDPRAAMGLLAQAQGKATITNLKQLGQNLLPAAVSVMGTGDSPEQAAELFVTLNALMKDMEGAVSKTATIGLATQLREFVPESKGKDERGEFAVPKDQIESFAAATTTAERIEILQRSPELRRQFLGKASFEKQAQVPIQQLLAGDATAMAVMRDVQGGIAGFDTGIQAFEDFVGSIDSHASQRLAGQVRRNDVREQVRDVGRTREAVQAEARRRFDAALQDADLPGLDAAYEGLVNQRLYWGFGDKRHDPAVLSGVLRATAAEPELSREDAAELRKAADALLELAHIWRIAPPGGAAGSPPEQALGR